MDFWNKKDLNGPPVLTYITKQRMLNIPEYTSYFTDAIYFTSNHSFLKQEAALLSRINYKMKWKFSKDKFLNAMQKTSKALHLYLQLDMETLFTMYKDSIPPRYEKETYFPTIDMLDFVLVRLQGASRLLIRIRDCSRTAALYLGDNLMLGHFWKLTILCFGLVSRLAQAANQICRYFSNLYDNLLKYRLHFKNAGEKWLPDNYAFPISMQTWLDVEFDVSATDNLQTYDLSLADSVKAYNNLSSITVDSESDTSDEVELVDEYFDLDDIRREKSAKRSVLSTDPNINKESEAPGVVFVVDSEEEDSRYGVAIDKFGNLLHNVSKSVAKDNRKEMRRGPTRASQINNTIETNPDLNILSNKERAIQRKLALEKILPKIFQNQGSSKGKPKQSVTKTLKRQIKTIKPNKKNGNRTRSIYLNLNTKHAFREFLNVQQKLLKRNNESCLFSHLNHQQFVNFRRQIHFLLNNVKLPKEQAFQQCREVLHENMDKAVQRIKD